jgi:hypothetical protein
MKNVLWNLRDKYDDLWAQQRWTWSDEIDGYKIEIRYFQGTDERAFVVATQANMSKKRELIGFES